MNSALDAFNITVEMFNQYANKPNDIGEFFKYTLACEKVEKALKTLDVIKKKQVNVQNFIDACSYMLYERYEYMRERGSFMGINMTSKLPLTKEEFDLLKEELK